MVHVTEESWSWEVGALPGRKKIVEKHFSAVAPSSVLVPATALLVRVRARATPSSHLAFETRRLPLCSAYVLYSCT